MDSRFVSYPTKKWKRNYFDENKISYCYILSDLVMNLSCDKSITWINYTYRNDNYHIGFVVNNELDFHILVKQSVNSINSAIAAKDDERLNWRKEFTYGNYRINYTITTDDPNRWVIESFEYVKSDELNKKKHNSFSTSYSRTKPADNILIQRKILFSSLESLQNH